MSKKYFDSKEFGQCKVINDREYANNSSWHDLKQNESYMIVTDDNNNYYARYNPDNDGADRY